MANDFTDLEEFLDPTLRLPVRGKTYIVPPITYEDGLWAQAVMDVAVQAVRNEGTDKPLKSPAILDDDDERSLYERMLGLALVEMRSDGLDWPTIQRCGTTAYLFWVAGKEPAVKFWREGPGEAPGPNRAQRRASLVAAPSTRSRASTASTSPARKRKAG